MKYIDFIKIGMTVFVFFFFGQGCDRMPGCSEGESKRCYCVGGITGMQECQADSTWGRCDCGGGDSDADSDSDIDSDSDGDIDTDFESDTTDYGFRDCSINNGFPCFCNDDRCGSGDSKCLSFGFVSGNAWCAERCLTDSDCPDTRGYGSEAACRVSFNGVGYCILLCDRTPYCPPGLVCLQAPGAIWRACS